MSLEISKKVWHIITVLGVAVVLLWSLFAGLKVGRLQAQSVFVSNQASEIGLALNYFYNDFGRYPTTEEFFDVKNMAPYFSAFPLVRLPGGPCQQSFLYKQLKNNSYQLGFCLPKSLPGWKAGINIVTHSQ